ncbi:MAG: glycoside hydrolase family 44 protein [Polyangiaceae bacterium]
MSNMGERLRAPRARASRKRGAVWVVFVSAALSLDCGKLTAEPRKAPAALPRPSAPVVAEVIYAGGLMGGWQDWGWGPHELTATAARLNLSNYGGWILHHDPIATRFGALMFRIKGTGSNANFLEVRVGKGDKDESFPAVAVGPERGRSITEGWTEIYLPWAELNPRGAEFDRITLRAKSPVPADWMLFDRVVLTKLDASAASAAAANVPTKSVKLSVSCVAPGRPINEGIYGIAGDAGDMGASARRWGGNAVTRYNWQIGASNVGKDWFFENTKSDHRKFLSDSQKQNTASALTIPIIGWIAKDATSVGFPSSVYGPQHKNDPYKPDAGDGMRADSTLIKPKAPTQTSIPAPPELMQRFVASIVQEDEKNKRRSVQQYILDNEPSLWNSNHRDVHPDPLTYDELLDRTIRYGTAIRTADPKAVIAGPAEWGWTAYFYSARDTEAGVFLRPDRRAHGDVPLIPWFLKKVHEHDVSTGVKVLDVLDVHYYPQGQGVWSPNSDPETAALRLRSTRALWDPSYKDESWINDKVRLIPRLKEWVAQNYPGLAVSLGEWNFGAEQHISGGLAVAEALGRFGTQGLDYAYYWAVPPKNSPAYWGFRAFRNFDGKNGRFLERSLDTRMSGDVSLFASSDATGKHVVLIALNLNPTTAAMANISMVGCSPIETQRRFEYNEHSTSLQDSGKSGSTLDGTLAPYSITVYDLTLK